MSIAYPRQGFNADFLAREFLIADKFLIDEFFWNRSIDNALYILYNVSATN
jgi:hypothetical protein